MIFSTVATILTSISFVAAAPQGPARVFRRQSTNATCTEHPVGGGQAQFSFPLANGFPNVSADALRAIVSRRSLL